MPAYSPEFMDLSSPSWAAPVAQLVEAQCRGFESHSVQLIFSNGCSECRFPLLAYPTFSPRDVFMYLSLSLSKKRQKQEHLILYYRGNELLNSPRHRMRLVVARQPYMTMIGSSRQQHLKVCITAVLFQLCCKWYVF